ncbi:MAG TPA: histidine kinase [Bacillus bacterium]|uniref:hybrid sensor histidine kinase/response regulator n=1 Tax=Siminovitchia fordii TaxID=254759 RepID=UPI000365C9A5|nr:ATP-binding protein [Siminovitchia fordii]HBZ09912.1 histidine kinase [Bacillus sp. (in: firmicutes)]
MKKQYIFFILGIFLVFLSSSRILWAEAFSDQKQLSIKNGQLDLRDWNAEKGEVLLLDGEWEFYPSHLLMEDGLKSNIDLDAPGLIQVPEKWNEALNAKKPTPFGYGSYRLLLHVNPEKDLNYSIRLPSVRSSSEVYVNGRLLANSGQVAKSEIGYTAKNLPYSTTFTADESGLIEIVVQVANYEDTRGSGIIRSIKFGSEEAIAKEIRFSSSIQLLAIIIFLMHSVYALILFFLGSKDKKLLYFSLLSLCVALGSLLSHDEKLFHQLFYIGYEWDFRLANVVIPIGCYALLQCTDHRQLPYWCRIFPIYSVLIFCTAGITMMLTPRLIISIFPVYYLLGGITIVIVLIAILKKLITDIKDNLLLLFSLAALSHHFTWMIIWRESGISVVHYPFDLLISIGCFVSIWFKDYFKIHAETKELAATLQRMNDHKDQFLANTSHEFKNPLHGMLNMSQSILHRERHSLQERSVKELETILSVGRRMTLLLNDLLEVRGLQEGNPNLKKNVIKVQPIVSGVLDILRLTADVKPLKIVNQIPDDFPPIFADENRVVQIFFNLLHNAVKYTNEGQITIDAFVKKGRAFFVITDTGIGMDSNMLKHIFHPYEQANPRDTMIEGGFGLGLSITKQLVELHGGTLKVSSVRGEGSEFTFSLSLADSKTLKMDLVSELLPETEALCEKNLFDIEEDEMPTVVEQRLFNERTFDRPAILIVDDDPVNLQVLETILPSELYDVTTAISGMEALTLLDTQEWDLVISDIMMPQMSGYELTRIIRERFTLTELPILLLTARSQPKDIQAGFLAGANDYVTKPVEVLELRSRIEGLTTIKKGVQEQLQLEAAWLQAQIQPHFLFNTLNAVIALSEIDLDKMRDLLEELSHLLRYKFTFQNMDELIPIDEELNIVRSYLYIEQVRYENRLQVVWEIDECKELKIPFLTIQPLVENAIRHGIMKRIRGGKIFIRVTVHELCAEISVEDDGDGMDEDTLQRIRERKAGSESGVGLINTHLRLKRHFGTGLNIESTPGHGTKVSFIAKSKVPNISKVQ